MGDSGDRIHLHGALNVFAIDQLKSDGRDGAAGVQKEVALAREIGWRVVGQFREHLFDGHAIGKLQLAEEAGLAGSHFERIIRFEDRDLDQLLAALGAAEPIIEKADDAVGSRSQSERVDAGCNGRIADADHKRDERHDDEHLDQRDA